MSKEKRNHFVSRGLTQFWAHSDRKVWLWDKNSDGSLE